jgi:hypothetical protein
MHAATAQGEKEKNAVPSTLPVVNGTVMCRSLVVSSGRVCYKEKLTKQQTREEDSE